MTSKLKVHPSFFKEFATKTWISPNEIVKELVENAFDEDATKVLITLLSDGSLCVEDNAGIDSKGMEKFLLLGSPHKKLDSISPKYKRIRTGRYGTGRLSFLTSFQKMKIKTRKGKYTKCIVIDESSLDGLFAGNSNLHEVKEKQLSRNGTQLVLTGAKVQTDPLKLINELKKLAILRQPLFQVFIKESTKFKEWNFSDSNIVTAPEIQGYRIPVNIDDGKISGELVIARRPLGTDEKGISILVGNHVVIKTYFGFDNKLNRITGFIRCDDLTSRFADKSALIEDSHYLDFNKSMQNFIINEVFPKLSEYEDVLITKEESKIYKQIDKALGQAVFENLESIDELQTFETSELIQQESDKTSSNYKNNSNITTNSQSKSVSSEKSKQSQTSIHEHQTSYDDYSSTSKSYNDQISNYQFSKTPILDTKKIKKTVLKKTFALKRIGYKVIPYEDESDSRYSFTNENIVFVNKANSAYKAESERGDEFLLRHIIRIVAEAIAEEKHPEGKEALELQNRLIAESIKIHNLRLSVKK
ncbi:MAG: ATP-binding protein [Nitrososphaeraceae archaeon]